MKNIWKLVLSFAMVVTVAFGMTAGAAQAYGNIEFSCDATPSNECIEVLEPDSCLSVKDATTKPDSLLQMTNFNPQSDARVKVELEGVAPDYWLEPETSVNFYFGRPTDFKVCNISDGQHSLITVKYPSYSEF